MGEMLNQVQHDMAERDLFDSWVILEEKEREAR
jgi:hypothetical protein